MYHRSMYHTPSKRLQEPRRFIQVLAGPRQTGKTTIVRQIVDDNQISVHYAFADEPTLQPGMDAFDKAFNPQRKLLADDDGVPLEKFILAPTAEWVKG